MRLGDGVRELLPVGRTRADQTHTHTKRRAPQGAEGGPRPAGQAGREPSECGRAGRARSRGCQSRPPDRQWPEVSFCRTFLFWRRCPRQRSGPRQPARPVRASPAVQRCRLQRRRRMARLSGDAVPGCRAALARGGAGRRGASVLVRADSPGAVGFLGRAGRRRGAASLCRRLRAGPWPLGPPAKGVRPVRPLAPSTHGAGPPARKPRHMAGESSPDFSCPRTMGLWQHEVQADTGEWSLHARRIKMSMILCT